jgi:mannosyltransferase OCH1-like enzyme
VGTWEPDIIEGVEQWLTYATAAGNSSMAYFLWLDEGCQQLVVKSEPNIVEYIDALPLKVEKSDVFRVMALNTIGGIVSVNVLASYSFTEIASTNFILVWRY